MVIPWLSTKSSEKLDPIFRRMKLQFVAIATLTAFIILTFVIGIINTGRQIQTYNEVQSILRVISDNDGKLPTVAKASKTLGNTLSGDTLQSFRYFSVQLSEDGILEYDTSNISDLTDQEVVTYAESLSQAKSDKGVFVHEGHHYAYRIAQKPNGQFLVVLDATLYYNNTQALLQISIWLGLISLLAFILIFSILSSSVVKPFIDNYYKQRQFITNAGHELKTPLAIISANNELVEMTAGESEWTKSTADQVTRLTGLINGLVSLARLEEQEQLNLTRLDFSSIVQDAAEDFKGPVVRDGKTFDMIIDPNIYVKADKHSLFELVTILVDNANKYCDPQGQVTVKLNQIGRRRKRAKLEISNSYQAGAQVDYDKFFDRFYRQDESHNSSNRGYGIGLSMAQSMVRLFKGSIKASYKSGMFTITVII